MRSRASILASSALAGLLLATPAAAQEANAEELFRLGKEAMAEKDLGKACKFFQESLKVDFALGTLLNLASCHEEAGKLASAWSEYRTLEDSANQASPPQTERAKYAHERAEALRPRVARLVITVSPASGDLTVKLDGAIASRELFAAGIPVDSGTHTITASAPEREDFTQSAVVEREAQRVEVIVPELKRNAVAVAPPVVVAPPAPTPEPRADHRTLGFVIGGVGAASLATGLVFGLLVLGPASDAKDCANGCTGSKFASTHDAYDKANTFGWISNVALVAGVIGVGVGTVLVLTSGSGATKKTARLAVGPNGAALGGTW